MDEGVVSRLADNLQGAGLIGASHKSQYIRWMLGKVRGDRTTDKYRRPYPQDKKRKPEYAGWEDRPFEAEKVGTKSKFIQALIPTEIQPPHNRRWAEPPPSEVRKRHKIARTEGFPLTKAEVPKTIEGLRELSARIMALPPERRPTLYGDDLRVYQPKRATYTRGNFIQRLALTDE